MKNGVEKPQRVANSHLDDSKLESSVTYNKWIIWIFTGFVVHCRNLNHSAFVWNNRVSLNLRWNKKIYMIITLYI